MCLTVIQNSAPEDAFLVRTLNIIKPAIPLDKAGYTLFYWRIRLITHSVFQCGGVGISIRYIAGLQREKVFLRLLPWGVFDGFDVSAKLDGVVITNVVESKRGAASSRVGVVAIPCRIRRGWLIAGTNDAFDDVIDEGEVSGMVAVIEHRNRLVLKNVFSELEQSHVRPSPGAVDSKEPQAGGGQPKEMAVAVRHHLVSPFGGCIELQRMVSALMLGKRHFGVGAVDAAGAGIGQMLNPMVSARF